ncbi:MAG: DUF3016 domain-containing protein [Betaproteobacteria bacterium]|nr:DUF3016 domain-containing protein [Betaproteobacteria bacterium]
MNTAQTARLLIAALVALLLTPFAATAQPAPVVEVVFEKSENFIDAYPRTRGGSERDLKETLEGIQRIFAEESARRLKAGDRLKITVTDLDLAGEIEPGRTGVMELRVLRRITWPRMTVRYSFSREGRESTAEATLSEPGYQDNAGFCARSGALCYERQMIGRWLTRQFG